jgi:hypothetical protein
MTPRGGFTAGRNPVVVSLQSVIAKVHALQRWRCRLLCSSAMNRSRLQRSGIVVSSIFDVLKRDVTVLRINQRLKSKEDPRPEESGAARGRTYDGR